MPNISLDFEKDMLHVTLTVTDINDFYLGLTSKQAELPCTLANPLIYETNGI